MQIIATLTQPDLVLSVTIWAAGLLFILLLFGNRHGH